MVGVCSDVGTGGGDIDLQLRKWGSGGDGMFPPFFLAAELSDKIANFSKHFPEKKQIWPPLFCFRYQ